MKAPFRLGLAQDGEAQLTPPSGFLRLALQGGQNLVEGGVAQFETREDAGIYFFSKTFLACPGNVLAVDGLIECKQHGQQGGEQQGDLEGADEPASHGPMERDCGGNGKPHCSGLE